MRIKSRDSECRIMHTIKRWGFRRQDWVWAEFCDTKQNLHKNNLEQTAPRYLWFYLPVGGRTMADIFPFFSCVIFKFPRCMHHVCVENFLNPGFLTFLLQVSARAEMLYFHSLLLAHLSWDKRCCCLKHRQHKSISPSWLRKYWSLPSACPRVPPLLRLIWGPSLLGSALPWQREPQEPAHPKGLYSPRALCIPRSQSCGASWLLHSHLRNQTSEPLGDDPVTSCSPHTEHGTFWFQTSPSSHLCNGSEITLSAFSSAFGLYRFLLQEPPETFLLFRRPLLVLQGPDPPELHAFVSSLRSPQSRWAASSVQNPRAQSLTLKCIPSVPLVDHFVLGLPCCTQAFL